MSSKSGTGYDAKVLATATVRKRSRGYHVQKVGLAREALRVPEQEQGQEPRRQLLESRLRQSRQNRRPRRLPQSRQSHHRNHRRRHLLPRRSEMLGFAAPEKTEIAATA